MIDIQKYLKGKAKEWKKESVESKKYRDELKKKVRTAQRKAYAEESVKRATEQARRKAKSVYSPKTRAGYYDQPISPLMQQLTFGTTPTPKQVVQKVLKKKKGKKGKKRKVSHVQPQTSQVQPNDIFWKY